jgi:2-dehydropantoate 2-reductase
MTFGELIGGEGSRVERLREALALAGIKAIVSSDIVAALWSKLTFIAAFGGVGAVTRAPAATLRTVAATRELLRQAIDEVVAVARAKGVRLESDEATRTMSYVDALPAEGFASMARDLIAGRRSELDALSGAVVRIGRESGVPTPIHAFIYGSLLPTELRARGELAV